MFCLWLFFLFCVSIANSQNENFNILSNKPITNSEKMLQVVNSQNANFKVLFNRTITDFDKMQEDLQITDYLPFIQMIDASTKIPNGIVAFSFYDLGNFDECYNIQTPNVTGKYCLGFFDMSFLIPSSTKAKFFNNVPLHPRPRAVQTSFGFRLATCAPSYLSAEEISNYTITEISEAMCYSKDTELDLSGAAIATIVVFAIVVGIAVCQTIYDIFLYYKKQKPAHELLIAFSFLSNGKKLLSKSTNPDQLLCLNGIRALSMMWVVIGHVFQTSYSSPLANTLVLSEWMEDVGNMYIIGATVSVDTFFLLGGMVTVYTFLKATDKGVKFNIFLYYIHRFLRLTPAYGATMLIVRNLVPYIEKVPLWGNLYVKFVGPCIDHWWHQILYIGNYFGTQELCVGQGWYLNVDMQLFVLSPLILVPLVKWPKYTIYAIYALIAAGCIIPFAVVYGLDIGTMVTDNEYMIKYYFQTYTRFGPYVIGMLFGYHIYQIRKNKEPIIIPKIWAIGCWLASLAVMVACVYAGHDMFSNRTPPTLLANSFYTALNRPAWVTSIGTMVFLCVCGYGGFINDFLSLHVFQFIAKLSYSIYLIHYPLIIIRYNIMKSPLYFSPWLMFHYFWGDFMFSLILAIPFSLLFESPIIILEKYLFGKH